MKRLLRSALVTAACTALVAACGGGVSQVDPFTPDRIIAFGDELSVLTSAGRKYTVNAVSTTGTGVDCESNPLWIQSVAGLYGYKFAQCQGSATEAKAITRAEVGATVASVTAQIAAQEAAGFGAKPLALVLVGIHDIRQVYEARTATDTTATLEVLARARGTALAAGINRMISLGAKVIVATAPDLGVSPYGVSKGTTEAAVLTKVSNAFNAGLRANILNDGRFVGLVLADEFVQAASQVPGAYGLSNVTTGVCKATLPDCDNNTASLIDGGAQSAWLWADNLRVGPVAHLQIGNIAAARARSNPF